MHYHECMSAAPAASRSELGALLGDVDNLVIERVLETGASLEEVGEALDDLVSDQGFGDEHHVPTSPRVLEVRMVLEELIFDDDEEPPSRDSPLGAF